MKTKEEILSMFFARISEYEARQAVLESECNAYEKYNLRHTSVLFMKLPTEIRLLADILGEDIPEEYWELIEKI